MKTANLPAFLIVVFGNTKNHRYLRCLAKMMFNKSHLGMCMAATKRHFITIKISPGELMGVGQGHRGQPAPTIVL